MTRTVPDLPAPGPDLVLADEVLAYVEAHPERWDQGVWLVRDGDTCQTSGCFAGWTAMLRGWRPTHRSNMSGLTGGVRNAAGEIGDVDEVARDLLRLTWDQTCRLFDGGNTLADLRQVVAELHGAPREPLSWEL
jgi:hypothetical protein